MARTVKVKLTADISDYTAGLVKAAAATRQLGGDVERGIDRDVTPVMKRAGEKQGGILARGVNNGLVRNSPLIAAGVAAALAAGAPVVLAGAAALFAGVGGLAAAQTTQVREAWTDLGHDIRDGAVEDAAVLVPVFERMADQIGEAFQRMRPEIREAFEAAAPLIDDFTDSLTQAAENALPGLVRAVERGGPVIEGLGTLMEDIGQGLSDFLDAMSEHSGAAGDALAAIGDTLAAALPLLGEFLGTGAELASVVLPPLADALGLVADVAGALGPVLPAVVGGFAAFKVASVAAGYLQTFAVQAQYATIAMSGSVKAGEKVGGALSKAGAALPALGIAVGVVGTLMSLAEEQIDGWAQALLDGGAAAATARSEMEQATTFFSSGPGLFAQLTTGAGNWATALGEGAAATESAEQRARELYNAMTPLDQAQQDVTTATNDLEYAVGEYGGSSDQAKDASDRLAATQAILEGRQRALEQATDGVTSAMIEQANQVLANASSDLAYRQSVDATQEAQTQLAAAVAEFGVSSEEAADAALQVEQAVLAEAAAAGQLASDALPAATSEAERNATAQAAQLAELLKLRDEMGTNFPAALNTTIARLQGTTDAGMVAAAQFDQLKLNVLAVPNSKTIIVESTTPEQIALLETLGFKVETLPDGTVQITAQTGDAEAAISSLTRTRYATVFVNQVITGGYSSISGQRQAALAQGGLVHAFAGGGFEPMRGGIAKIVPPNTLRVIGDRVRDDEAYIPINSDARSHDILRATADRMGYSLGREFSGMAGSGSAPTVNVAAPNLNGMRITGTVAFDPSGLLRFVDARVDGAMGEVADKQLYVGG